MRRDDLRTSDAHVLVDPSTLEADRLLVDDDTSHHLLRVLRLRDGAAVSATDGEGRWCAARLSRSDGSALLERTSDVAHEASTTAFELAVAIPKGDRLDWMVQKLTEIGVDRLVLLACDRSVVRWKPDRAGRQLLRLRRIADEALRQSRRVRRLRIDGPVDARTILPQAIVAEPGGVHPIEQGVTIAVGPEGGWSDDERRLVARSVDLGPTVLRTETAAIVVSTLCVVRNH